MGALRIYTWSFLSIGQIFMVEKDIYSNGHWNRLPKVFILANLTWSSKNKSKKPVSYYSNNPFWNPLTKNFLLTRGEEKVGRKILFMWINFK